MAMEVRHMNRPARGSTKRELPHFGLLLSLIKPVSERGPFCACRKGVRGEMVYFLDHSSLRAPDWVVVMIVHRLASGLRMYIFIFFDNS